MKNPMRAGLLIVAGASLVGCSSSRAFDEAAVLPVERYPTPIAADPVVEGERVEGLSSGRFYRAGRFVFGPQPTDDDLIALRRAGVGSVVNLRSVREAEDRERTPFDEPGVAGRLGMDYHHIPLGGDDGYEPADVDAFARILDEDDGDVLVHCASGGRVRSMMVAWLMTRRGYSPEQAEQWRLTVGGQPTSLDQLLGKAVANED